MYVHPDRLQRDRVPMLCARTGEPTTQVRRMYLWERQRGIAWYWWWLWGPLNVLVYSYIVGSGRRVVLPVNGPLAARLNAFRRGEQVAWLLALLGMFAPASEARVVLILLGIGAAIALRMAFNSSFVRARLRGGGVELTGVAEAFEAALRDEDVRPFAMPQVAAVGLQPQAPVQAPVAAPAWPEDGRGYFG